ncbi:MAG: hypothetical protein P4L81_06920 [Candidatus Pacebacteria bacterium]|nr:hypothetical protein [Candidatus Paceibacterota bacterium]
MEKCKWKLGDTCYIADVNIAQGRMRFRIMPARVVHVAGITGRTATAQSVNPGPKSLLGRREPFTEGRPFPNRWSAFAHVWCEMRLHHISLFVPIRFEGEPPKMEALPADVPELGQVVYGLDTELCEIFEAQIGYLHYEGGKVDVGYDQSPGNPEASNIQIKQWWSTRASAEIHVQQNHGEGWTFVSKEELARRTNAAIDKLWSDATEYIKSPAFQASMNNLVELLSQA